jgi:hypothetical protein
VYLQYCRPYRRRGIRQVRRRRAVAVACLGGLVEVAPRTAVAVPALLWPSSASLPPRHPPASSSSLRHAPCSSRSILTCSLRARRALVLVTPSRQLYLTALPLD